MQEPVRWRSVRLRYGRFEVTLYLSPKHRHGDARDKIRLAYRLRQLDSRHPDVRVAPMRAAPTGLAVYDGAFSPAAGKRLADTDIRTLGSYRRSRGAHTATEHFIESLLHELGEACDEVEYWGRESWRPVPAHADIDERCARERGQLRFPSAVLVAYVQVEPGLRAPTMLWAELPGGAPVLCAVPAVPGRLLRFDGEMLVDPNPNPYPNPYPNPTPTPNY